MKHRIAALALGALVVVSARSQQIPPDCVAACERAGMTTGVMLLGICSAEVDYPSNAKPELKAACNQCIQQACQAGEQTQPAKIVFPPPGTEIGNSVVFKWTSTTKMVRYRLLVGTDRGDSDVYQGELTGEQSPVIPITREKAGKPIYAWLSCFDGQKWLTTQPVKYATQGAAGLLDYAMPRNPQQGGGTLGDYFGLSNPQPNLTGAWVTPEGGTTVNIAAYGKGYSGAFRFYQLGMYGSLYVEWNGKEFVGSYETRDTQGRLVSRGTQRLVPDGNRLLGPWVDEQGRQGSWTLQRAR